MIYLVIIIVGMILVAGINILCGGFGIPWHYIVIATIIFTLAVVAIDGLVALIIRKLPNKWFTGNQKCFNVSKKELRFYDKIGIKKWKEKVPELGGFTDFHKNKIADPHNNEYLEKFILEACYGIVIHFVSFFTSFFVILLDFKMFIDFTAPIGLSIGLLVAIVNAVLIVLPTFILRYNLPRLKTLHKINLRTKKKDDAKNGIDESK